MYTVFSHSLQCFYRATVFSKATVFYALATLLTFVPPLLIAFRSQGVVLVTIRMIFLLMFRVVQLDLTPEIQALHLVFDI